MSKRPTLAEKLLHRIDARIAALTLAREELVAEIEATVVKKANHGIDAASSADDDAARDQQAAHLQRGGGLTATDVRWK